MKKANRIRQLREELDITQIELAKFLNITSATVSQYELGKRFPGRDMLEKISNFFRVSVDYLLGISNIRVQNDKSVTENNPNYVIDVSDLPEEAIKQVEEYIELVKLKYNSNEKPKKGS